MPPPPNPGPPPQFHVPSLSETAHTPQLLVGRWLVFLSFLSALGLFVLRMLIARPVARRAAGTSLRPLSVALAVALLVALLATPVYVLLATAQFSLRSVFDVGALVPQGEHRRDGRGRQEPVGEGHHHVAGEVRQRVPGGQHRMAGAAGAFRHRFKA